MAAEALATHDATGLAALVRAGEVTPRELAEAAIARIEALDGQLNALVSRRFERALAEIDRGLPDGPFRGVPFLLKDIGCSLMEGEPNWNGSRALKELGHVAAHDSYPTRRLRAAGLVVLGRTNTPEFGMTYTTEPTAFGATRNPWDLTRSPGGSSGGSAAAVAAGYVPAAHANDGGGSIRVPASATGLVGLKTSRARVSNGPEAGEIFTGLHTEGTLARTVRDVAGLLDVLAGGEPGDPYVAPPPARPYVDEVGADPGRLRIGVMPRMNGYEIAPVCVEAAEAAGRLLERLGHHVDAAHPASLDRYEAEMIPVFYRLIQAQVAFAAAAIELQFGRPIPAGGLEPLTLDHLEQGARLSAADYLTTRAQVDAFTRATVEWWERDGWDLLVTPVMAVEPFPLGYLRFDPADREACHRRLFATVPFTGAFNLTGQPAISLPLHWSESGLPIGVQLVAAPGREDLLLRLAAQLEQEVRWADRRPALDADAGS